MTGLKKDRQSMVSRFSRRVRRSAPSPRRYRRRVAGTCSVLGAVAILSVGLTPGAAAADVQPKQWYLSAMKAEEMWKASTGKGVKVAVVDTGVNPDTPSLKGQVLTDEVPKEVSYKATEDYDGHGTSMAELIAGTGADGTLRGLAPDAKIVPYRVALTGLDKAEMQKAPHLAKVIRAIADSDVKIINMSFGGKIDLPDVREAMKYAHDKGKLMFAGTGNDAMETEFTGFPAAYPYVVGVAASDESGVVGEFSQHGNYVDLAAPGLDVPTWCDKTFRSYCTGEGTSMASAIASASAALVWSAHPDWTANQVLASLIDTAGRDWARDDPSTYLGYGLIRPRKVLENKDFNPGPADTDPLAKENFRGVVDESGKPVAASSSPSTEPSKGTETSDGDDQGDRASATASETDTSGNTTLWVALGAAAAALVIGGGAFAVIRSRRGA
ncbi:secreted serine protease [Streptomyces viridosporus ATCC 14672]|uniref:Secreted serine protease n=1 Tax=Streptomyces viridosporus (strain ATCC 14672 / DSM 40746 / JCM 4963 / KCTC 9882 / NRRL B-12104 / FH 1290) TaxID=566461 RepID=D5ZT73_STRV1|nr:secreted serine protease [Streptomyces viridosporus ATCC 14672]